MMKMDREKVLDKLIDIFSKYEVSYIVDNNDDVLLKEFGIDDMYKLIDLPEYGKSYKLVEELKQKFEANVDMDKASKELLTSSLKLIKKEMDKESVYGRRQCQTFIVLDKVVRNIVFPKLTDEEKKIYENVCEIIIDWKHFFLSYTNRNAEPTNKRYIPLLTKVEFDEKEIKSNIKTNYVAKLIAKYLKSNNISAFFDKDNIRCGDDFEDKIKIHCQTSFSFVQLIQRKVFEDCEADKKNWCFVEYKEFQKKCLIDNFCDTKQFKRHYFFIDEEKIENVKPANLCEYTEWYEKVSRLDHISVYQYMYSGGNVIKGEFGLNKLKDKVDEMAKEIYKTREDIIKKILDSIITNCPDDISNKSAC